MLWWHWIVLGVVLVLLELAIPAFFLIWFGLGALLVGIATALVPSLPLAAQVGIWTVASITFIWFWFKIFRRDVHKTQIGQSRGAMIGEIGLVTRAIGPYDRGEVRFQKPILGAEVWEARAESEIAVGDRVRVVDVEGNLVKVVRNA